MLKHLVSAGCAQRILDSARVEPPAPPTDDLFAQNPEELDD